MADTNYFGVEPPELPELPELPEVPELPEELPEEEPGLMLELPGSVVLLLPDEVPPGVEAPPVEYPEPMPK